MSLSCECGDYDVWYDGAPADYSFLETTRRKRCCSCRELIDLGAVCLIFDMFRDPKTWVEENIHGDQVPLANQYLCEECGDMYYSLEALGFCVNIGDEMRELVRQYNEDYVA